MVQVSMLDALMWHLHQRYLIQISEPVFLKPPFEDL